MQTDAADAKSEAGWERLNGVETRPLAESWTQLHWLMQIACGAGKRLLAPQPDAGEQSFVWLPRERAFAQDAIAGREPFRPAVFVETHTLALLDARGDVLVSEQAAGRTVAQLAAWWEAAIATWRGAPLGEPLEIPSGLPDHPLAHGAAFEPVNGEAAREVARHYANAHGRLEVVRSRIPGASPLRCWPHHFDLATLITIEEDGACGAARSVGAGLAPADGEIASPYLYVTPWPLPHIFTAPLLPAPGHWHAERWTGCVLQMTELPQDGAAQESVVTAFLEAAVTACVALAREARS